MSEFKNLASRKTGSLLPGGRAPSLRANFARCAIDLAIEHHSGLIRVAEAGEYGTAAALLRPLLESSTSAFWFMYVASCAEICALPTTAVEDANTDIPMLGEMARLLVPIFPAVQTLVNELKKGGRAKWFAQVHARWNSAARPAKPGLD